MIESKEKPDFEYFCKHILTPPIKLSRVQKKMLEFALAGKPKGQYFPICADCHRIVRFWVSPFSSQLFVPIHECIDTKLYGDPHD